MVCHGGELIASGAEGIRGLAISNAPTCLPAWKEDWVSLPLDEDEFAAHFRSGQEEEKAVEKSRQKEAHSGEYLERWNVRW